VAEGAALMTETSVEISFEDGYSPMINNHYLADLQAQAMQTVGPMTFSDEEIAYAQAVNDAFPGSNADYIDDTLDYYQPPAAVEAQLQALRDQPLIGINLPALDEGLVGGGSTDVGDLSHIAPVSMLNTVTFPTGVPGHSWGNVATCGMSIGHKGMMHAAKTMAIAAAELLSDPAHLVAIREEFERATGGKPYVPPIPDEIMPPPEARAGD
jgi:aminobenzoyl-glutamate utilization protein B